MYVTVATKFLPLASNLQTWKHRIMEYFLFINKTEKSLNLMIFNKNKTKLNVIKYLSILLIKGH
jgi:hypothetical protein